MRELINDPFYKEIKAYDRCIIDYCLIEDDTPHQGYRSHKDAVLFAMCKVIERYIDYQLKAEIAINDTDEEPFPWSIDMGMAKAERIDPFSFLHAPDNTEKNNSGKSRHDSKLHDVMSYRYAFAETPHISGYGTDDFVKINNILFPNGAGSLEVYEWTTDWSNYFDAGHEWWGAACWSVYDSSLNRYAVLMASATD